MDVNEDMILIGDVRKSFTILKMKEMPMTRVPGLILQYECFDQVRVISALLWIVKESNNFEKLLNQDDIQTSNCLALIGTEDGNLKIYQNYRDFMMLKREIYVGRPVVKIIKKSNTEVLLFQQDGKISILKIIKQKDYNKLEMILTHISEELDWEANLSPIQQSFFPSSDLRFVVTSKDNWFQNNKDYKRGIIPINQLHSFWKLGEARQREISEQLCFSLDNTLLLNAQFF